jgi:PAS domain S-box-containing protein
VRDSVRIESILLAALVCPAWAQAEQPRPEGKKLPLLTRVEQIRKLTPDEAARGYPVRVQGVVTYHNPQLGNLYVQDSTGGIYVETRGRKITVPAGRLVKVEGISTPGLYAPNIGEPRFTQLGKGRWPVARRVTYEQLASGREVGQWLEVRGVVRAVTLDAARNLLDLRVGVDGNPLRAIVQEFPQTAPAGLVDATVRLRGVCGSYFNKKRQFTGFELRIPDLSKVKVEEPAPDDPYQLPVTAIGKLLAFTPRGRVNHRVKVQGAVLWQQLGRWLYIKDQTEGLRIQTEQKTAVQAGDRVEVLGFVSLGEYTPVMQDAVFRRTGNGPPSVPVRVTAKQALAGDFDSQLVQMEGLLLDRVRGIDEQVLVLQSGGLIFNARLAETRTGDSLAFLSKGSRLQLTGISAVHVDERRVPRSFELLLRSPKEIVILQRPPWWTLTHTLATLGLMMAVILASLGWATALRRRVRVQTNVLRQKLEHEAALEQRYRDLFENAKDMIYSHDLNGRFTALNRAGEEITGYSRDEALRMTMRQLVAPEERQKVAEWTELLLGGAAAPNFELKITAGDGQQRTLEVSPRLIYHAGSPVGVEGIARDITERKRVQQELQRAKEAAEAASRAKSEFLANMSHEIRTPMNGIVGMTELALDTAPTPEQRDCLETVKSSAASLLTVINDILDFSKIEAGKLELERVAFGLRECLERTMRPLALRARQKGLKLSWQVPTEVPDQLIGDAGRLQQVLTNLVGNAIKFTEQGEVAIQVQGSYPAPGEECFELRFSVRDTGIGIPADKQSLIFEAFAQADGSMRRKYGGTGLGLAISSQLVGLMGGRLWLESQTEPGTTFYFTARFSLAALVEPQRDAAQSSCLGAAQAQYEGQDPASSRPLRVLLAEDNAINKKLAARILERRGHRVTGATNGREALAAMEAQTFDLILMDLQMPEMDGFEATAAIRRIQKETGRHVPILALTAHAMKGDRERCLAAGMDGYLSKPIQAQKLIQAVESLAFEARADAPLR